MSAEECHEGYDDSCLAFLCSLAFDRAILQETKKNFRKIERAGNELRIRWQVPAMSQKERE